MPSVDAHARPLSGCCWRKVTSFCGSHDDTLSVPPYRPSRLPEYEPPLLGGGVTFAWSVPTLGANGLFPVDEVGSSVISSALASSPPDIASTAPTIARITRIAMARDSDRLPADRDPTAATTARRRRRRRNRRLLSSHPQPSPPRPDAGASPCARMQGTPLPRADHNRHGVGMRRCDRDAAFDQEA